MSGLTSTSPASRSSQRIVSIVLCEVHAFGGFSFKPLVRPVNLVASLYTPTIVKEPTEPIAEGIKSLSKRKYANTVSPV